MKRTNQENDDSAATDLRKIKVAGVLLFIALLGMGFVDYVQEQRVDALVDRAFTQIDEWQEFTATYDRVCNDEETYTVRTWEVDPDGIVVKHCQDFCSYAEEETSGPITGGEYQTCWRLCMKDNEDWLHELRQTTNYTEENVTICNQWILAESVERTGGGGSYD